VIHRESVGSDISATSQIETSGPESLRTPAFLSLDGKPSWRKLDVTSLSRAVPCQTALPQFASKDLHPRMQHRLAFENVRTTKCAAQLGRSQFSKAHPSAGAKSLSNFLRGTRAGARFGNWHRRSRFEEGVGQRLADCGSRRQRKYLEWQQGEDSCRAVGSLPGEIAAWPLLPPRYPPTAAEAPPCRVRHRLRRSFPGRKPVLRRVLRHYPETLWDIRARFWAGRQAGS
jgi:hypothetical protein